STIAIYTLSLHDALPIFPNDAEGVIFSYDNKRFALQVWNPRSVRAQQFSHIEAFDWSTRWIVEARLEKVPDGTTVATTHHRNPRSEEHTPELQSRENLVC